MVLRKHVLANTNNRDEISTARCETIRNDENKNTNTIESSSDKTAWPYENGATLGTTENEARSKDMTKGSTASEANTTISDFFDRIPDLNTMVDVFSVGTHETGSQYLKVSLQAAKKQFFHDKKLDGVRDRKQPLICAGIPGNEISSIGMEILGRHRNKIAEYCRLQNEDQCFLSRTTLAQAGAISPWKSLDNYSVWIHVRDGVVLVMSTDKLNAVELDALKRGELSMVSPEMVKHRNRSATRMLKAGDTVTFTVGTAYLMSYQADSVVLEGSY